MPLHRSRSQQFDDLVLEAAARLEPRWERELASIEFAVQEVPGPELLGEEAEVPLGAVTEHDGGPRIVVFRRPVLARAQDDDDMSDLVFDVVIEQLAEVLGLSPETVHPDYGGGEEE